MIKEEPSTSVQLCTSAAMASRHAGKGGNKSYFPSYRWIITCLGLLNVVLLIVAIVIGIMCAKVKEGSVVSHSVAAQVISELNLLQSNHSSVMEDHEEAMKNLENERKRQGQLKEQIEQKKTINDQLQKQLDVLINERTQLKYNLSLLEGSCSKCPPNWILANSSCYYFSFRESPNARKNWLDSRADCISRGAELLVFDNTEEQIYLSRILSNSHNKHWIGVRWNVTTEVWTWVNNATDMEPVHPRPYFDQDFSGWSRRSCGLTMYSFPTSLPDRFREECNKLLPWICEKMFT